MFDKQPKAKEEKAKINEKGLVFIVSLKQEKRVKNK